MRTWLELNLAVEIGERVMIEVGDRVRGRSEEAQRKQRTQVEIMGCPESATH